MNYTLVIKEEAAIEIRDAFTWYEEQKEGLGSEFVNLLEQYLDRIIGNPLLYPIDGGKEHVAIMKQFPYKIVYSIEQLNVMVYAIFHTSRNPDKLKR